jgi:hypothetical protein
MLEHDPQKAETGFPQGKREAICREHQAQTKR